MRPLLILSLLFAPSKIVLYCLFILFSVFCQWVWLGGTNVTNLPSEWGSLGQFNFCDTQILGVTSDTNYLASRELSAVWVLSNRTVIFWGGLTFDPFEATFNDMWKYEKNLNGTFQYTWIGGPRNDSYNTGTNSHFRS